MNLFPNPVEAVIFDMDGLLLDTERIYFAAIMGAAAAVGFAFSEAFCHAMIGVPDGDCDLAIEGRFGPSFPIQEFRRHCGIRIAGAIDAGIPVKPGAVELIDHLAARDIPIAVATSSRRAVARRHLARAGLLDRFQAVATRDDVARGKPSPDLFVKAAGALGTDPARCLALEDSHNGIRAAHAAGTMPVMVPDILAPTDEIRALCVAVAESLDEVRRLLAGEARDG